MEAATLASGLRVIIMLLVLAAAGACAFVHKTIESDDGDVIDCVDIYQQPALKHAPPGSRVIQLASRDLKAKPEMSMEAMVAAAAASKPQQGQQTWRKHGSCPAGTVPIRRDSIRVNPEIVELVRRSSPFRRPGSSNNLSAAAATQFGRRAGSCYNQSAMAAPPGGKVEVAAAFATNGPYLGARARVPYWKVDVHPGEFSMSYILIGNTLDTDYVAIKGADPPAHLTNQIAAGLVAWPSLFKDSKPRIFVYYTNDEGVANNCFNLDCGGFHLTGSSKHFALGSTFVRSDSQVGGDLYTVTFGIHRDLAGKRWWVSVMDQDIGYYPESVFNTRFPDAAYVEMGGRVLDSRPGGKHTTTPMGSGMPACAGWGFAATIKEYHGVSSDGVLFNDDASRTIATTPRCYGVNPLGMDKSRGGFDIAYGGPGGIHCDR